MNSPLMTGLLWTTAISSGVMAGIYFAFSGFIMAAFDRLGPPQARTAMNAINETILGSWFIPLFFGSTAAAAGLVVMGLVNPGASGAITAVLAGGIYVIGMFMCTVVFNVPLNQALAKTGHDTDGETLRWTDYRRRWTRWNHLRTVSSAASSALAVWVLIRDGASIATV